MAAPSGTAIGIRLLQELCGGAMCLSHWCLWTAQTRYTHNCSPFWLYALFYVKLNYVQHGTNNSVQVALKARRRASWFADGTCKWLCGKETVTPVLLCCCLAAQVPITPDLVYSFGPQSHHLYSLLAGTFYAPVVSWVYTTPGDPYYAWDALTAVCWMEPSLCKVGVCK